MFPLLGFSFHLPAQFHVLASSPVPYAGGSPPEEKEASGTNGQVAFSTEAVTAAPRLHKLFVHTFSVSCVARPEPAQTERHHHDPPAPGAPPECGDGREMGPAGNCQAQRAGAAELVPEGRLALRGCDK